jgi:hypothetical protein
MTRSKLSKALALFLALLTLCGNFSVTITVNAADDGERRSMAEWNEILNTSEYDVFLAEHADTPSGKAGIPAYDAATHAVLKNQNGFTGNQVRWLARNLEKQNKLAGKTIPTTICYHMPSAEFIKANDAGANAFGKNDASLQVKQGEVFEAPMYNKQSFLQILKTNGTDSVFVGHHNENSLSSVYEGIRWTFGLKSSKYGTYDADMLGGTFMKIPANATSISVEHIYVD